MLHVLCDVPVALQKPMVVSAYLLGFFSGGGQGCKRMGCMQISSKQGVSLWTGKMGGNYNC